MARIAGDAQLGVATLYRHYADRQALVDALQIRALQRVVDLVDEVLIQEGTGLEAVETFLVRTVEHGDDLFLPYHGAPPSGNPEYERLDKHLWGKVGHLVGRGVADRTLRTDLSTQDLIIFGALIANPLPNVDHWQDAANRQIRFFLRSVAGPAVTSLD